MLEQPPPNDLQSPDNMQMQALSIINSGVHATIMAEWKTSTKAHVRMRVAVVEGHATKRDVHDWQTADAADAEQHHA